MTPKKKVPSVKAPKGRPVSKALKKARPRVGNSAGVARIPKCWRIAPGIAKKVKAAAKRAGLSDSAFVELALAEKLGVKL